MTKLCRSGIFRVQYEFDMIRSPTWNRFRFRLHLHLHLHRSARWTRVCCFTGDLIVTKRWSNSTSVSAKLLSRRKRPSNSSSDSYHIAYNIQHESSRFRSKRYALPSLCREFPIKRLRLHRLPERTSFFSCRSYCLRRHPIPEYRRQASCARGDHPGRLRLLDSRRTRFMESHSGFLRCR